jgi:hypothetical protein
MNLATYPLIVKELTVNPKSSPVDDFT